MIMEISHDPLLPTPQFEIYDGPTLNTRLGSEAITREENSNLEFVNEAINAMANMMTNTDQDEEWYKRLFREDEQVSTSNSMQGNRGDQSTLGAIGSSSGLLNNDNTVEIIRIEPKSLITRFGEFLSLESSTSQNYIELFELCSKIDKSLELSIAKVVYTPANDTVLQGMLKKKLRDWLITKKMEGGEGVNKLDSDGLGVLHYAAALGYDWAIQPIHDAGVSINFLDRNGRTALDWASSMGRKDMVNLLKSCFGAKSGREPTSTYPPAIKFDIIKKYPEAKKDWLPNSKIHEILQNHERFHVEQRCQIRPPSGSLFLFNRNVVKNYRQDNHKWQKKNGKTKESHVTLQVVKPTYVDGYYVRGEENANFCRRSYLFKGSDMVLVHYLEKKDSKFGPNSNSNSSRDHYSDDNPEHGRKRTYNALREQTSVNEANKSNDGNPVGCSNGGWHQNLYLSGPGTLLFQDDQQVLAVTSTESSSESSFDGNFSVEDKDNYPSLKEGPLQDGFEDDFEIINSFDCQINKQLEDVTGKTMQACSSVYRGTVRSEDEDEGNIPTLIENVDIADAGSITYKEALFRMRFENLLSLELGATKTPVHNSSSGTSQLHREISAMLECNLEWDLMGNLTKQGEFSQDMGEDQILQRSLKEKLCTWLLQRITEDGKGLNILDEGGQGVLHFVAALGYDWAILPTMAAGVSINFQDANGWTALHWAAFTGRESMVDLLVNLGATVGVATNPSPKYPSGRTPEDLASSSGHNSIFSYLAEYSLTSHISSITLQDSSQTRSDLGKAVLTVPKQSATPIGVGYNVGEFGVSDDNALSLLPIRTNKSGQDSEPVHAAAVRIQNKYRSRKGRKDFLLTQQQIIKIQAHVRGHQVRLKKALDAREISTVEYPETPHGCHDSKNIYSGVRANKDSKNINIYSGVRAKKDYKNIYSGVRIKGCLVESCEADLSGCKAYNQRHRVCEVHAKAPVVLLDGVRQRFCQQCSRFHEISEFDQSKRSCRRRLAGLNERRRFVINPETVQGT